MAMGSILTYDIEYSTTQDLAHNVWLHTHWLWVRFSLGGTNYFHILALVAPEPQIVYFDIWAMRGQQNVLLWVRSAYPSIKTAEIQVTPKKKLNTLTDSL